MHIATKSSKIDITHEKDTKSISQRFSKNLSKGDIIFLHGEIGVGKTTFVKYLINNLQIKYNVIETEVPSPTFNILYQYKIKDLYIQHYDLYKIKNIDEIKNIGLFENYKNHITFVEWPKIISKKPKSIIELIFSYEENFNQRSLIIKSDNKKEIINEFR